MIDGGRIDLIKLCTIIPYQYENSLILPFAGNWIEVFGKIPEFEAKIDAKGRLLLISKDFIKKGVCRK